MNSRNRILTALEHREPDRVPVDLGGTESSGITGVAYNRLKKHLNLSGRTQIYDISQMICKVEWPVVESVASDAVPLLMEPRAWKPWTLQDGSPAEIPARVGLRRMDDGEVVQFSADGRVVARSTSSGYYLDGVSPPLADARSTADIEAYKHFKDFDWPDYIDETYEDLNHKARELHQETDYLIVGNLWVHILAAGQILRGFANFMMDLIANQELAHCLMENLMNVYMERVSRYAEAVGEYVQVIEVNDDLGTQFGPQLSPDLYRKMIKPYHKKLWEYIKEKTGCYLLLHSCGSVYDFIPDFIEMGIDALNPVQVSARNMDTARLKREFGSEISFWGGGCDTQRVLPFGTPDEVEEEVKRRIDDLAPGGGFVFTQVHNIQPDVPPENIMAMYKALDKYGK
ncbi:uroporphyrinogen decarboxylase family protein [Candidatus Poribacteria bacterium]